MVDPVLPIRWRGRTGQAAWRGGLDSIPRDGETCSLASDDGHVFSVA
jgi:hypothetical protein